jgi:uncharacterized membrane protein
MDIGSFFGLPAHPLLVHIPVVLTPLAAIGAVAIAVSASLRRRIGWIVVAIAGVALVGVQLAMGSGEQLEEQVRRQPGLADHIALADTARPLVALLFVVVVAIMVGDFVLGRRRQSQRPTPRAVTSTPFRVAVSVVTVAVALLATTWIFRTGHQGAKVTWNDVGEQTQP